MWWYVLVSPATHVFSFSAVDRLPNNICHLAIADFGELHHSSNQEGSESAPPESQYRNTRYGVDLRDLEHCTQNVCSSVHASSGARRFAVRKELILSSPV